ncbi:31977_t:CDS:1, partial [Racocetra persica]
KTVKAQHVLEFPEEKENVSSSSKLITLSIDTQDKILQKYLESDLTNKINNT